MDVVYGSSVDGSGELVQRMLHSITNGNPRVWTFVAGQQENSDQDTVSQQQCLFHQLSYYTIIDGTGHARHVYCQIRNRFARHQQNLLDGLEWPINMSDPTESVSHMDF